MKYKIGIRVQKTLSPWFGFGFYGQGEKAIVISFYKREISIGKVFNLDAK